VRKSIVLVLFALTVAAGLAASSGPAAHAGNAGPMRDGGRGLWFKRACSSPLLAFGACGAQVVTNGAGTPLASASPPPSAYGPTQFHTAYNLPAAAPNAQTIGIVDAYDDPNIEADLATFSTQYGLPPCTTANGCFTKINQNGSPSYPAANANWALEISLDVEIAHAMCQNCKILLVEATTASFANLGAAENEAAARGATVISNSWGGREYSTEGTDESRYFNHPGIAITASTGDSGYGVEFPSSSRYVTAVGGTTLKLNPDNSWLSETAWADTGSGCSFYITKPSWQKDTSCSHRTDADVAADADPNTGAAVYDSVPYSGQSGWFQVGGTSLASPLIASAYALAGNEASLNGASTAYADTSALHDVTSGSNGFCGGSYLCTAKAGYDGPTGLGSPNGLGAFGGSGGGGSPPPPPPPTPDFSLGMTPTTSTVTAGTNAVFNLNVSASGGFSGPVDFSETGLPNALFSPASVNTSGSASLTVGTTNVGAGSYPFTVTARATTSGGTITHSVDGTLVVQASAPPPPPPPPPSGDFSLSVSPTYGTIWSTSTSTYKVTITPTGGFSSPVTFSASGLLTAMSGSFSPNPATSSSTFTLVANGVPLGRFGAMARLTITGTSGTLSHSVTLPVFVS
jgi:hypothetical protein